MIASSTLIAHWFHFFFWGGDPSPTNVWYERAVWGNVVAVLPLALLGAGGLVYHHVVLKRLHAEHSAHLKAILEVLDPDSDGGLPEVLDRLDPETPGGIKVLLEKLDELVPS